jgi:hypothetical protein
MNKLIIGIDPDLHKSGIAIKTNGKLVICTSMFLWEIFYFCEKEIMGEHLIVIEDGNLGRSANWHGGGKATAANVGKNQAIATILREFCQTKGLTFKCVPPAGYSKLFDNEDLFKRTTGWNQRTNKDARSACAIIWGI